MIKFIENFLIFIILYVPPLMVFIKYMRRKGRRPVTLFLISILYIVFAIFTQNVFPFILVLINIHFIRSIGSLENTYFYRSDYEVFDFKLRNLKIIDAFRYSLTSYLITFIISIISYLVMSYFKFNLTEQEIITDLMKKPLGEFLILVPIMVVFAPVVEEFTFRWLLFEKVFNNRIGVYASALLSSLMFAMVHFNLKSFVVLTTVGLVNCYLIHKKGYWYAVFNHAFFNLVTATLMLFQKVNTINM